MDQMAGKPYWRVAFDESGQPADAVADELVTQAGQANLSDLFVFSHGWGTSESSADDLYNAMFPLLDASATTAGLASVGYVGIVWPSIWFPDPAPAQLTLLRPDVAATRPGAIDALLSGAEIAATLAQCYPDGGVKPALEEMGALIDDGLSFARSGGVLDPTQRANVERFHTLLCSLAPTPVEALADKGEAALITSNTPVLDYERLATVMGSASTDTELSWGDLGNIWDGAKDALRIASYYEMKGRAGVIGVTGLGPRLEFLHTHAPQIRVHLIGHSFGARLVAYALGGITSPDSSPVTSLTLIQGAFSHWSFTPAPNMPWGDAGALSDHADRVHGALVSTFSQYDWAIGQWYPRASFLSNTDNSIARELLNGTPSRFGGLGADGYQGVDPVTDLDIHTDGTPYGLTPGRFYRVNAEAVIKDTQQNAFGGAHSDIRHQEIADLIMAAAMSTTDATDTSGPAADSAAVVKTLSGPLISGGSPIMRGEPTAGSVNMPSPAGPPGVPPDPGPPKLYPPRRPRSHMSLVLTLVSAGIAVSGLLIIVVFGIDTPGAHARYAGVGLLTAFAALCTGILFGFLFGIPRLVSSGELRHQTTAAAIANPKPPTDGTVQPQDEAPVLAAGQSFAPSTNLAEVSDWLTKLLLGAGLVQLTNLGAPLGRLTNTVAAGLADTPNGQPPSGAAQVMAGAIMVTYIVVGFLDGYLVTTLWYGKRLDRPG